MQLGQTYNFVIAPALPISNFSLTQRRKRAVEVCAVSGNQHNPKRRDFVTIIVNGVALLAFGLAMTGWLNPWLGVVIMGAAFVYWEWEIFTSPKVAQYVPGMLRFLGAVVLAVIVLAISIPRIQQKIAHSKSDHPAGTAPTQAPRPRSNRLRRRQVISQRQK